MSKEIQLYLSHLIPLLEQRGMQITDQKEISYGAQIKLQRQDQKANINLYYSAKRGLTKVIGAPDGSALKPELEMLLYGETEESTEPGMHLWHAWIGSDECGKGDFFGPLIVSAFYCTRAQVPSLTKMGVQDSKKLNDTRIVQIAKQLYLAYPGQGASLILNPPKYNELISSFKRQNQNLNDLLAWGHETAVSELMEKELPAEGILIDQFSKAQKAKFRLSRKYPNAKIIERTGAERDIAVAAASILSRYQFLEAMAKLNHRYQMSFPLGASPPVIKAGHLFVEKYGIKRLPEVAKVHFKTSQHLAYAPESS